VIFLLSVAAGTSFLLKEIGPVNSMTATGNSWVAATEAKLNATYALHIQGKGVSHGHRFQNSASD
jgi:hypothetical protein